MKKILLFIIAIIILMYAYSEYKEYQRFHPKNANIQVSEHIDVNYHNKETVYKYFRALEDANNYMQMQWSANEIDVRSPEKDNAETKFAVAKFADKVAKLNYFKALLEQSKTLKNKGLNNNDIKHIEVNNMTISDFSKEKSAKKQKQLLLDMMPESELYSGESSAFIYEIQKLLVDHGFNIPVDGVYKTVTSETIKAFQLKNNLFPDGKINVITLEQLIN